MLCALASAAAYFLIEAHLIPISVGRDKTDLELSSNWIEIISTDFLAWSMPKQLCMDTNYKQLLIFIVGKTNKGDLRSIKL